MNVYDVLDQIAETRWFTRAKVASVFVLAFVLLWVLAVMGDPEPALPRCPTDRPAHVECRP